MTSAEERLSRLEGINEEIRERMTGIETRIGSVETRIASMETRISSMETRIASMETRIGSMETRTDARFNSLTTITVAMWVTTMLAVTHMPPEAQKFFDYFVDRVTNKVSPFPLDWDRFYSFVHVCHDLGVALKAVDFYPILTDAGFPPTAAQQLSNFYRQGRDLLDRPDGYNQLPTTGT